MHKREGGQILRRRCHGSCAETLKNTSKAGGVEAVDPVRMLPVPRIGSTTARPARDAAPDPRGRGSDAGRDPRVGQPRGRRGTDNVLVISAVDRAAATIGTPAPGPNTARG